jgi:phage replication O-like protein O
LYSSFCWLSLAAHLSKRWSNRLPVDLGGGFILIDENFTKVPNTILNYLMTADLNMTQFRIFNAVVRETFGWHREWCWMSLSVLAQKTNCNQRQVERELRVMIEKKILKERGNRMKRELQVNALICSSTDSLDGTTTDSLDGSGSDSLDGYIKKDIKEKNKENNTSNSTNSSHSLNDPFLKSLETFNNQYEESNFSEESNLKKKDYPPNSAAPPLQATGHFLGNYESSYAKEIIDELLETYYHRYRQHIGKEHPGLKYDQLVRIYDTLRENEVCEEMIEEFFSTVKKTDFNLNHFATDGMLLILKERVR